MSVRGRRSRRHRRDVPNGAGGEPERRRRARPAVTPQLLPDRGGERFPVIPASDIPATLSGAATFNVLNALAAVAITVALGGAVGAAIMSHLPEIGTDYLGNWNA